MAKLCNAKCKELQREMTKLGGRLDRGDESALFIEVIPGKLMCSYRPLRRDRVYGGPQRHPPAEAAPLVSDWVRKIRTAGIESIICLMGPAEFGHYTTVCSELGATDLINLYERHGLKVRPIPWNDPAYPVKEGGQPYEDKLLEVREESLQAFDELPKPVLLHCSSGIQRSSPVLAFVYSKRSDRGSTAQ
jgi:hypothetical protein